MKLAIIYDRVNTFGGAERVLLALHEIWPDVPLFTAVYNQKTASWADVFQVKTTFLQKIPFTKTHHELLPFLTPLAFSKLDLSDFDVIFSVTSAEAKFISKNKKQVHICYCLTPTRYLWSHNSFYQKQGFSGIILKLFAPYLKNKDFVAAQKVDHFIAISQEVKNRIKKYYDRNSIVIYPPVVNTQRHSDKHKRSSEESTISVKKPFYLIVSRFVPYKRIDLAIKACNQLKRKLIIIGFGSQEKHLRKISDKSVTFKSHLTDSELASYYNSCRALIFPSEEDFGIVPVEAQSFGKPVIAYAKGGACETVIHKKTGILFPRQTVNSLKKAIIQFEQIKLKSFDCQKNAQKFTKQKFQQDIKKTVETYWNNYKI